MSEVRLPLPRGASAPTHTITPSTANMAAQRGRQFQSDDGGEDRSTNGQQVDENDQNEDTARLAAVERRLDQQDRERREHEARIGLPARCRWKWKLCFFRCRKLCPHTNDWGRNGYISRINKSLHTNDWGVKRGIMPKIMLASSGRPNLLLCR